MDPVAQIRKKSLADSTILSRAILDSFRKLDPRTMVKNPVMFVVEVGAILTTFQLAWNALHHAGQFGFGLQITLWLWFTVLFANFAEAMAEGRGKAQADTLRKARAETQAHRLRSDGSHRGRGQFKAAFRRHRRRRCRGVHPWRRRGDRRRGLGR